MKYPKLSALFGAAMSWLLGGADGKGSHTAEQQASLEASEKKIGEMEADLTQAKADNEAHTKTIGERDAKITELNAQVTSIPGLNTQITNLTNEKNALIAEKAELQKKLDVKPTGTATTVVPDAGKEASQAADPNAPKAENKYFTSVDADLAALKKANEQLILK